MTFKPWTQEELVADLVPLTNDIHIGDILVYIPEYRNPNTPRVEYTVTNITITNSGYTKYHISETRKINDKGQEILLNSPIGSYDFSGLHSLKKRIVELKYDPKQAGDKEDDI